MLRFIMTVFMYKASTGKSLGCAFWTIVMFIVLPVLISLLVFATIGM